MNKTVYITPEINVEELSKTDILLQSEIDNAKTSYGSSLSNYSNLDS